MIQVLSLSPKTKRSNEGIVLELRESPQSAKDWIAIGREHREFFRVVERDDGANVALIARNSQEGEENENGNTVKPILSPEMTAKLMDMAADLHDRQYQQSQSWKTIFLPILISVVAAVSSIAAAVVKGH